MAARRPHDLAMAILAQRIELQGATRARQRAVMTAGRLVGAGQQ